MNEERITLAYLEVEKRVFIVPDLSDIEYGVKVYGAKLAEVSRDLEAEGLSPERKLELEGSQDALKSLVTAYEKSRTLRTGLLARPDIKTETFSFTPPNWGMLSQLNAQHRQIVEGRWITDTQRVHFDLLRKCVPGIEDKHPAFAEHFLSILRRSMEVNIADLPFI